jgi:rhodanese-related sulfurtransferase
MVLKYAKNLSLLRNAVKLTAYQYQPKYQIARNFTTSKLWLDAKASSGIVEIEELLKVIQDKVASTQVTLIDVREVAEHKEGSIPTAKLIPLGDIESALNLSANEFESKYGFKKPGKDEALIFHCRSGARSQKATDLALKLGFKNSRNYKGSWLEFATKQPDLIVKN